MMSCLTWLRFHIGDKYAAEISRTNSVSFSPGNGLGLIQIQLDFFTWILMDLDLIGYGYPIALDSIGLDFVG